MNFIDNKIGSAIDNLKSPIHNWYKFTAGFSHKFVDEIIYHENLKTKKKSVIFDPFAGCGTTLVSAQKEGVRAIGNEAHAFMYDIIRAKINWKINPAIIKSHIHEIENLISNNLSKIDIDSIAHPLMVTLYDPEKLKLLYLIRDYISSIENIKYHLFLKLALSQTLHKVALHPIVPYISRKRTINSDEPVWQVFSNLCHQMYNDTLLFSTNQKTSKIYKHDSRKTNRYISDNSCNISITSPPYLNNLDYGEVSKVHTHFFEITSNWNDITERVRKKLVTGSTTHYSISKFNLNSFLSKEFSIVNREILPEILSKSQEIREISKNRAGKKSFDILILHYFNDMFQVLKEIRRIIRPGGALYMILGDSAPYGVYIQTTEILGKIATRIGFNSYEIQKIRTRGTKWKNLKYRHNQPLAENVLILK